MKQPYREYCRNPRPDAKIIILDPFAAGYRDINSTSFKMVCEQCGETIAAVPVAKLEYPLRGDMFQSPNIERMMPAPFYPMFAWQEFQCPVCLLRPITYNNAIYSTDDTYYVLLAPEEDVEAMFYHPSTQFKVSLKLGEPVKDMTGAIAQFDDKELTGSAAGSKK